MEVQQRGFMLFIFMVLWFYGADFLPERVAKLPVSLAS